VFKISFAGIEMSTSILEVVVEAVEPQMLVGSRTELLLEVVAFTVSYSLLFD
jgi:hypothetical protein